MLVAVPYNEEVERDEGRLLKRDPNQLGKTLDKCQGTDTVTIVMTTEV